MAVHLILIKVLKTSFPLAKEYFLSSKLTRAQRFKKIAPFLIVLGFIVLTAINIYLSEQAKQNLTIHEPIIRQFNDLNTDKTNLEQRVKSLQNNLYDCERRAHTAINECQTAVENLKEKTEFVYDPATNTMVKLPPKS